MNIIKNLKKGDERAFKEVFKEYHEKLYFYTLSKTNSAYLAEETVQITFVKLWQYRHSLTEDFSLSLQLFRIAKTTLIDLYRKQTSASTFISQLSCESELHKKNPVEEELEYNELKTQLSKSIDQLPPNRKRVFELHRFDNKTYNEIASELSISVKTVEMHISKALKQLRTAMNIFLFILTILNKIIN